MLWTLFAVRVPTLVTWGDAVASFLEQPDDLTKGRCLMNRSDVDSGPLHWRLNPMDYSVEKPNTKVLPQTFHTSNRRRWFTAASIKRWTTTVGLIIITLLGGVLLLAIGVKNLAQFIGTRSPFSTGAYPIVVRTLTSTD